MNGKRIMKPSAMKSLSSAFGAALLVGSLLAIVSCGQAIGLGQKVDLTGPTLTITGPDYMANVQQTFNLTGTVTDDLSVANVTVKIDGADCAWKNEKGSWLYQATAGGEWTAVTGGVWTQTAKAAYSWTLPVTIPGVASGEYVIRVSSTDDYTNQSAASVGQRTLVCDTTPPVLTINSPLLFTGTSVEAVAKYAPYSLKNAADLDNLVNGPIVISGSQVENSLLAKLEIEIADAAGNVYWTKTLSSTDKPTPNLRNFSVTTEELKDPATHAAPANKVALQIITRSYDQAGNSEAKPTNGWFCYWPASDEPWAVIPADASDASKYSIYPGYSIQGQAFDDDGLKSVTISVYQGTSGLGTQVSTKTLDLSAESPKSYSWSIDCPSDSGTYTLVATCADEYGKESTQSIGVFTVEDLTLPAVYPTSPDESATLFGDSSGNFTFAGTVDDNSGVADLRIAWIDPQSPAAANSQLLYLDPTYSSWKDFLGTSKTDANGNKVWVVTLGPKSKNANSRMESSFAQTFNIFSDLGISVTKPLSNQTFILLATDDSGKTRVAKVSTAGDTKAPALTVDSVTVRSSGGVDTVYPITNSLTLPALVAGDKVFLKGTWSDDSTNVWADKSKRGALSVLWGTTSLVATAAADGTWSTAPVTAPSGAVAAISASLTDYGQNLGTKNASFYVETDTPQLLRVSSETADGSYAAGAAINVFLDFNKKVTFGSTGVDPVIQMSNGTVAHYVSGNGTTRHKFTYTVTSGDANTTALDATNVISNGNLWRDATGKEAPVSAVPTGTNSFAGSKSITIDTVAPYISSLSTVSAVGSYKAGGEIYITVTFSEPVTVSDKTKPRLELSSGTGVYTSGMNQTNAMTYMMTYTVAAGQDTSSLSVDSFDLNGATIKDAAGNALSGATPSSIGKTITVDTTAPAAPAIAGINNGVTYYAAPTFTVDSNGEAVTTIQYSVDNGTTWKTGTGATLSVNGTYNIVARQIDGAGNVSPVTSPSLVVTVDTGALLQTVSSTTSDGIYTTGDKINITLNFRKAITVKGAPTLTLNSSSATVACSGGSGTKVLTFLYTIHDGESATRLNVTGINTDGDNCLQDDQANTIDITMPVDTDSASLAKQKNFKVITGIPTIQSMSMSGTDLVITYDRAVYKNAGSMTLTQTATDFRVPAVLTASEFAANNVSSYMSSYYAQETNGASSTGTPDTGLKYVLNYTYDTNTAAVVTAYRQTNAYKMTVPVASSAVSINGNVVTVGLTGSFALPVKGATYSVSIPAGFFKDVVNNQNAVDSARTVTLAGVEPPVIRVNKVSENITSVTDISSAGIVQPTTTTFKIDCETPGSTLAYTMASSTNATAGIVLYGQTLPSPAANPTMPNTASTGYSGPVTIGNAGDTSSGYKYAIAAKSTSGTYTAWGYEDAFRSVLIFNNTAGVAVTNTDTGNYNPTNRTETVWVRGGDGTSGTVLTPNFPLSWDVNAYSKVRAMTKAASGNSYYWISWQLNVTAYVGLLAGSLPDDADATTDGAVDALTDAKLYGPKYWSWAKNSYVPFKEYYPVFPGESRTTVSTDSDAYSKFDTFDHGAFMFATASDGGIKHR